MVKYHFFSLPCLLSSCRERGWGCCGNTQQETIWIIIVTNITWMQDDNIIRVERNLTGYFVFCHQPSRERWWNLLSLTWHGAFFLNGVAQVSGGTTYIFLYITLCSALASLKLYQIRNGNAVRKPVLWLWNYNISFLSLWPRNHWKAIFSPEMRFFSSTIS